MKLAAEIENPEVRDFARRAQTFVEGFGWCERVTACRLAFAIAGVLGIFPRAGGRGRRSNRLGSGR